MERLFGTVVLVLVTTLGHGTTVTCIFSQDCVLPCTSGYHDVIHWYRGEDVVHSFFQSKDQLRYQDVNFSGRTSLFNRQISEGNLSLLLRGARIRDQGRYKCYTADKTNNKESFISVTVKAPIKAVEIEFQNESAISCSTSQVFPEPKVSWSVDDQPRSEFQTEQNEQDPFSINSTLNIPVNLKKAYRCSISLRDLSQTYTASIRKEEVDSYSGQNATVRCPHTDGDVEHYNLSLRFDSAPVLTYISHAPSNTTTTWRDTEVRLVAEGGVAFQKVDQAKHEGTYTCEVVTARSRDVVQTRMRIRQEIPTVAIIAVIVVIIAVCVIAGIFLGVKKRKKAKASMSSVKEQEPLEVNTKERVEK